MKALRFLTLSAALATTTAWGAAPVIDDPVPLDGNDFPVKVEPNVPVGKVLLFPITASDTDGDILTYKVTSSNPKILVRARTGQTRLKMNVAHAAGASGDSAFTGTMEFLLMRDLTPVTSDLIGGFAQAPYYANTIFHRIANLDSTEQPDGSFIAQGGDPHGREPDPPSPQPPLVRGPGYSFANEFSPAAIFTGRGQLAMANAGINAGTYLATNGSQFFVTAGQPRFLDFNHTIFGQLVRGWDIMDKVMDVPRNAVPPEDEDDTPLDRPLVEVTLQTTSVEPNFTDAILEISAKAPGEATITVEVSDGTGTPVTKTFTVTAVKDTKNTPPFLEPVSNKSVAKDTILNVPLKSVDLENDFVFYGNKILLSGNGQSSGEGNPARLIGGLGFAGQLNLGAAVTQYDMSYRGSIDGNPAGADDQISVNVAVGDKKVDADVKNVSGTPGVALTNVLVAKYSDGDPTARAADFTAKVNWGDGTALDTGTVAHDSSKPSPSAFLVTGTHTYANAGTYPLSVELSATKGQRVTLRGVAVVTTSPLRAFGREVKVPKGVLTNGIVATLSDSAVAGVAAYSAEIVWGDGSVSEGTIRKSSAGELQVLGSHKFIDAEDFSLIVRVRKTGGGEAIAWSLAKATGFEGKPHLPPFDGANLVGALSQTLVPGTTNMAAPLRETVGNQTFSSCELVVVNGGSKASAAGKIRFYLSQDKTLNLQEVTVPDPDHPGQTIVTQLKDLPLTISSSGRSDVDLEALQPGAGVRYIFVQQGSGDSRLRFPAGENGAGLNILAHLDYSDPLTNNLPVKRDALLGPFDAFIVQPTSLSSIQEPGGSEAGTVDPPSRTFTVRLAKKPTADVTVAITATRLLSGIFEVSADTDVGISPATLTFTAENWNTPQVVTVTAKDDEETDGNKSVTLKLAPAESADLRYDNVNPPDVSVLVRDKAATTP